jgi:epidermal growth factor receptor substrate 15
MVNLKIIIFILFFTYKIFQFLRNLCDIGSTGKLNCEQFALAMHFVEKKKTTGLEPPATLSPEMIPPSLRPKKVLNEETNQELLQLETQVSELQREKLYYEQRANEHDSITRQKRTTLSNLELEMESIYKALHAREIKNSEESKKLIDTEERFKKLADNLADIKEKFKNEEDSVEKLKCQIQFIETTMKEKDIELRKSKLNLQTINNEKNELEDKLNTRKLYLNDLKLNLNIVMEKCKKVMFLILKLHIHL